MKPLEQLIEFEGEVVDDSLTLTTYSRDASIFEIRPEAIARPKTKEDVEALVKHTATQKPKNPHISLTARAAGTDMTGGAINDSVIVDFTAHMNRVGEVVGNTITAEPGAYWRDVEKKTLAANLIMPSYPASRAICAVGGMVANNSGGELTLNHGQVKNWIEKTRMVFADGKEREIKPLSPNELEQKIAGSDFEAKVYREIASLIHDHETLIREAKPTTSKNSTGYQVWDVWQGNNFDLNQIIVGSQGTLGLITEATFRLTPIRPHKQLLIIFTSDITRLGQLVQTARQHKPETFELFDDHTLRLAVRFLPDIAKRLNKNIFSLLWQFLPEMYMTLTGGLPKLILLAEFSSENEEGAKLAAQNAAKDIESQFAVRTHLAKNSAEAQKYWTVRRESFNLLRQHAGDKISAPFVEDFIVHPQDLAKFLPRLREVFARYPNFEYTFAGHAGDGNFHIIPFVDLKDPKQHEKILKLSYEVYDLIKDFKGSISAEHNDGLAHGAFLDKMYSPQVIELFNKIKRIFDPQNIFNPGKKSQATVELFMKHMRKG